VLCAAPCPVDARAKVVADHRGRDLERVFASAVPAAAAGQRRLVSGARRRPDLAGEAETLAAGASKLTASFERA
jgi:hypothetical protein